MTPEELKLHVKVILDPPTYHYRDGANRPLCNKDMGSGEPVLVTVADAEGLNDKSLFICSRCVAVSHKIKEGW